MKNKLEEPGEKKIENIKFIQFIGKVHKKL